MSMKQLLFAVSLSVMVMSQAGCGGGGSSPSAGGGVVSGSDGGSTTATTGGSTSTGGATTAGGATTTDGTATTGGAATAGGTSTTGAVAPKGIATLSWDPPSAGITGFKVHYGATSRSYSTTINTGMVSSFAVSDLPAGTYYFVVTSYDSSGNESGYSNEVSKTIS
jgi:hypothetical protein